LPLQKKMLLKTFVPGKNKKTAVGQPFASEIFFFQISQPFETTVFYHTSQQAGAFQTAHPGAHSMRVGCAQGEVTCGQGD
jgi:hypothetical protein